MGVDNGDSRRWGEVWGDVKLEMGEKGNGVETLLGRWGAYDLH